MTIKLLILSMFSALGSMVNEFSIVRAEVMKEVSGPALPGTFDLGGDRLSGGGCIVEDGLGGGGGIVEDRLVEDGLGGGGGIVEDGLVGGGIPEGGLSGGGRILDCMIRSTVSDTKKSRRRASAIQGDQGDCWPDVVAEMRTDFIKPENPAL